MIATNTFYMLRILNVNEFWNIDKCQAAKYDEDKSLLDEFFFDEGRTSEFYLLLLRKTHPALFIIYDASFYFSGDEQDV